MSVCVRSEPETILVWPDIAGGTIILVRGAMLFLNAESSSSLSAASSSAAAAQFETEVG